MSIYDHYYANKPSIFEKQYDFITASEVVEHLFEPKNELARLWNCLKPGGCLGIMTKLTPDHQTFAKWYYKNDPTHICFFSKQTFEWLAEQFQAKLTFLDKDIIILQKNQLNHKL
jgi:2-polyprenyl-3-methyl-5-hydroxy-6-metoxy-1,4-benzoquinol methylase